MTAPVRIGVDVGGTKIEVVAIDPVGATLWRNRLATPQGDYDATVATIAALVEACERELSARATVGLGHPGSTSPVSGLHRNSNSTCMNGRPFVTDVARRLGRAVRATNDANCFALSEAVTGAGRGADVVFGVILGTGVGGGVVIDGKARDGRNGVAGEWGHSPMPGTDRAERDARPCYCGLAGCREQFLSGPAIERDHRERTGESLPLPEITRRAASGDAKASATIDRLVEGLALSLASVVNLLDPDCIVLGGGVSNVDALYERVPPRLAELVFGDCCTTPVLRARHGDSSGVFGAAMLW